MNNSLKKSSSFSGFLIVSLLACLALPPLVKAAPLTLATTPLATSTTSIVKPNLMFILDNSGSMGWEYLPDSVQNNDTMACYRNGYYNGVYYNADITYAVPIDSLGNNFPNSSFTGAWINGFSTASGTTNLATSFMTGNDSVGQAAYYYKYTGTSPAIPVRGVCYPDSSYTKVTLSSASAESTNFANWYSYYRTRMLMMKSAAGLAFRTIGNTYRVGFSTISYTGTDSTNAGFLKIDDFTAANKATWYSKLYNATGSGSTPLRGALSKAGRLYAGKLLTGANDPIQYACQQNFTILSTDGYWNTGSESSSYGPYQLDNSTPVGNQDGTAERPMYDGGGSVSSWTVTYAHNVYSTTTTGCNGGKKKLKTQPQIGTCIVTSATGSCTPSSWTNKGAATTSTCVASPVIPNPNPSAAVQSGSPIANSSGGSSNSLADVAMYYYQTDLRTPLLGNCTGAMGNSVDVCTDESNHNVNQRMVTYTLGLGANGKMKYSSSYLSDSVGDYVSVHLGNTASSTECTWQTSGACNWPVPGDGKVENIDDLWHAAVNGRGAYFSATDPTTLSGSLSSALASIDLVKGAAAAAATSTLNPVAGNNYAFVASYTTVKWQGNLEARGVNVDTGTVNNNADWCVEDIAADTCASPSTVVSIASGATTTAYCSTPNAVLCNGGTMVGTSCLVQMATACNGTLKNRVSDISDTRKIYTPNDSGTALIPFDAAYATTHAGYFDAAHISALSQWSSLTPTQKVSATGSNLLNYLRGQYAFDSRSTNPVDNRLYRYRESVMGDALESQPTFIAAPVFNYPYAGYSSFKAAQANRSGTVFIGANDGFLHAFVGKTGGAEVGGDERWAFAPSMVVPNMWKLADTNYKSLHANYVNGSPVVSDIFDGTAWHTILVAGLNGGGRGYYALDITVPNSPVLLWEFTTTSGIGKTQDDDVGYGFLQPVVTKKEDGTWVVLVTSGYNNINPGSGGGYLFVLDAYTGSIISKIGTGVGTASTPSGLSKITAWNQEPAGNLAGYVYGGDLQGNLWRFDINANKAFLFASLFADAAGASSQPITAAPVLGLIKNKRVVFIGTGKYLETADLTDTQLQTQYAIQDDDATTTLVNPRNSLVGQTLVNNGSTRTSSTNSVDWAVKRGWYVDFPDAGERVNIDSMLEQGILVVPTTVPSSTVCSPGGYSWINYFCYETGAACLSASRYADVVVGITKSYVNQNAVISAVTSRNPTPQMDPHGTIKPPAALGYSNTRVIWRQLTP